MDPAPSKMVILGKSTGGQVVRTLVEHSGESVWNSVFTTSINQLCVTDELRTKLAEIFYFQPEPYVRRVIFLTTAHRGSKHARQLGLRYGAELIRRDNPLRDVWADLKPANGLSVFQPFFQNRAPSSADGMEAGNPLLSALDGLPIAPEITYHSIIANINHQTAPEKMSDGLVAYKSAHLEGTASEFIVSATHVCENNADVIAEVQRILTLHLNAETGIAQPAALETP